MRTGLVLTLLLCGLTLSAAPGSAAPELALQVGRSFGAKTQGAVAQVRDENGATIAVLNANRRPHGSFSIAGSALWPWEERFRFGVQALASDMGSWNFLDEAGEPPSVAALGIGGLEVGHLAAWGGGWRADVLGPEAWRFGRSYASATYGYYRWEVDRHGHSVTAMSSLGASLGLGIEHRMGTRNSLGVALSATRMTGDFTEHFFGAGLEWRWRP